MRTILFFLCFVPIGCGMYQPKPPSAAIPPAARGTSSHPLHYISITDETGKLLVKYSVEADDIFALPKSAKLMAPIGGAK